MSEQARNTGGAWAHRAWHGYHPRAAVPAVLVAAAAALGLMVGRWHLPDMSDLADRVGAWVYFVLSAGVWVVLVVGVAYRLVTFTYLMTDRALVVDFGFRYPPVAPVFFTDVTAVTHGANWLGRCLGVGWVMVTAGPRTVTLPGVRDAAAFAAAIRAASNAPRES